MNEVLPLALFAGLLVFAAASDVATMKIPNWVSVALAGGYAVYAALTGSSWASAGLHFAFGAAVLVLGFLLFQVGVMGGGDAKLIAAAAVWTGHQDFLMFAFWTALAGGVLALVLMLVRRGVHPNDARPAFVNRLLKPRGGVPYGVAIAAGGLMAAGSALTLP